MNPLNSDTHNDDPQLDSTFNAVQEKSSINPSKISYQHDLKNDSWNNFQVNKLSRITIKDIDKFISAIKINSAVIISSNKSMLG